MKKIIVLATSSLFFANVAHAFGESPLQLQEQAARVMAQQMDMSRDQINQMKALVAKNSPIGGIDACTDYGMALEQNMAENIPSMPDKLSESIKKFATWGCVVKNGM